MLLPSTLMALLLAAPTPTLGPDLPAAIAAVPDETGVVVLPDAAILQTVVADVDADGGREVVRLVRGDGDAVLAEIWVLDADGWHPRGDPVEVVPPSRIGTRLDPVYQSTPVRLLVRKVAGTDRVTVASQPHFEEIDVGPPCCLVLHDLGIEDGVVTRRAVSGPSDFATAVIVIDFDGDGTDELLSTQSLPPAGDISYPILARVHRWSGDRFDEPVETQLRVGSGDTPFVLGDSDGIRGEEAAIISTLGPPGMFRIRLVEGDQLALDAAGLTADGAIAVPLDGARGVAAVGPVIGLMAAPWPPGEPVSAPVSASALSDGRIIGTIDVDGQARLVVHRQGADLVHLLQLPGLGSPDDISIARGPAAAAFTDLAVAPFSGPVPGDGPDGAAAIIHHGRLIPSSTGSDLTGTAPIATLAGAEPVGLVGDALDQIVLHHGPVGRPAPDADGGALLVPVLQDQGWTSIAPFELTRQSEADDAELEPSLEGAIRLDTEERIGVGPGGFVAELSAPRGSRVLTTDLGSAILMPIVVPDDGRIEASFVPPSTATEDPAYLATLIVLTPAGHAYLARWDVQVLTEPPPLELSVETPLGSSAVVVRGLTARYATVSVGGTPVEVSAGGRFATTLEMPPWPTEVEVEVSDGLGNAGGRTVSGIGLLDYRQLPWVPITAALVAVVGLVLFLRVPRSTALPRRADDDAALEELEPD